MRQILQNLRTGRTEIETVPCPATPAGHLLIGTQRTLISAGTERMIVDFSKANLIDKARQQPDKVRMVLDKVRTDGLVPTLEAVRGKLDQPLPLGYCNVGRVLEVGRGVDGFEVGDRVASNGHHAEVVSVPRNLAARLPDGVDDDAAAFTVIGAIALQGIRLAAPTLGEAVAVFGLGLIGQITVQLLRANGCRVIGFDFDPAKLALAERYGAETMNMAAGGDPVAAALRFSRGRGVDAVILTASTRSSEPVSQAANMSRKRGRIVLVGVTGLELSRAEFFEKELTFQVSCSYGPGRYDPEYEQKGRDYPLGFVRWTEQRNMEAVLDMMADRRLDVAPLISHRFPLADAPAAYALISGSEPSLGVLLDYPAPGTAADRALLSRTVALKAETPSGTATTSRAPGIAVIGSGNYAGGVLIPAFGRAGARLTTVVSSRGLSGVLAGRRAGFEKATTDTASVLADPTVDAVVIATQHDSHADLTIAALDAGKDVFVEKPVALTLAEVDAVVAAVERARGSGREPRLMVGFNRRFAPHVVAIRGLLAAVSQPKAFVMTVNAGQIPANHWTQDPEKGGGRIIGEACHFVDLLRFLAGHPISGHGARFLDERLRDTATLSLTFADGSIGTIHYFANGSRAFPKERLEVFAAGRVIRLDNFRRLEAFGWPGARSMKLWRQDKGQAQCAAAFVRSLQAGGASPIPFDEIVEVARVTIALATGDGRATP